MLKKMCPNPPCTNMYVTIVHGRRSTSPGKNMNSDVVPATVCCTKNIRTFAISRRRTQGVTRGSPSSGRGRRVFERFEGSRLLFPDRERDVELRTQFFETRAEAIRFLYSTWARVEFRVVQRRGHGTHLCLEPCDLTLGALRALACLA